jgi:hypothetical protein
MLLNARTSAGVLPVIGFKWWEFADNWNERANWGLVTRRDNAYDGVEARLAVTRRPDGILRGGEERNYGNFLGPVKAANQAAQASLTLQVQGPIVPGQEQQ